MNNNWNTSSHSIVRAECINSGHTKHNSRLLPQIFCTSKLEDQTPERATTFWLNSWAEVQASVWSKTPMRFTDLPKENERILEEDGDTRIHDRLFCKRQQIDELQNEAKLTIRHMLNIASRLSLSNPKTFHWTNRTYEELQILQTESTWRQWGSQKPTWSRGRATLERLQTKIRMGGVPTDAIQCCIMGLWSHRGKT